MASRNTILSCQFLREIASDIYKFAHALGMTPTWQQRQLFDAVQRGETRIAVKSGQGPGKTRACVVIGLWRLLQNEDHKILVVAPTMAQAKDVWLAEAEKLLTNNKVNPIFRKIYKVTATEIGVMGKKAKIWGVKLFTGSTSSEKSQGQHAESMDVIFEEASGIPAEISQQYQGTMTNSNAMWLQIGNPNTRSCPFFHCFNRDKDKWCNFTWNAEETPISKWYSGVNQAEIKEMFGRDSDVYRVRVLGEFPHTDPNCVMSTEILDGCFDRSRLVELSSMTNDYGFLPRQFGIDFARFGSDEATIYRRQGYAITKWAFQVHKEPSHTIDTAFQWQRDAGWSDEDTVYVPDTDGMGQGAVSRFYENSKNCFEFHTQHVAQNAVMYANQMTEAWFNLRSLAKKKQLLLPKDPVLIEQLTNRVYKIDSKGRIILESKDDHKKRGFSSPDRGDGVGMAFYDHAATAANFAGGPRVG